MSLFGIKGYYDYANEYEANPRLTPVYQKIERRFSNLLNDVIDNGNSQDGTHPMFIGYGKFYNQQEVLLKVGIEYHNEYDILIQVSIRYNVEDGFYKSFYVSLSDFHIKIEDIHKKKVGLALAVLHRLYWLIPDSVNTNSFRLVKTSQSEKDIVPEFGVEAYRKLIAINNISPENFYTL